MHAITNHPISRTWQARIYARDQEIQAQQAKIKHSALMALRNMCCNSRSYQLTKMHWCNF